MKVQPIVSLDPIDRRNKKRKGLIGRFFITKRFRGKKPKIENFGGHYLFTGRQRTGGKTTSALWFYEHLKKKYKDKFSFRFYTNMGLGVPVTKRTLLPMIKEIEFDSRIVHVFVLDEIQSWFPKDTKDKETMDIIDGLTGEFSQIGKRNIFVLSTSQIYGRVHKSLREQCLYMVYCHISPFTRRCINEFIDGDDTLCDELGRWSGDPQFIYIHGLPEMSFDTHRRVSSDG